MAGNVYCVWECSCLFNYRISLLIIDSYECPIYHFKAKTIVVNFQSKYIGFINLFYPGNHIVSRNVIFKLKYFSYLPFNLHLTYSYWKPVSISNITRNNISGLASYNCYSRSETQFLGTSQITTSICFQDFKLVWPVDLNNATLGVTSWNVCSINRIMFYFHPTLVYISFQICRKSTFWEGSNSVLSFDVDFQISTTVYP